MYVYTHTHTHTSHVRIQRLAQESRADNLQLVEIAQRLGIQLKYSEPPERAVPAKMSVLFFEKDEGSEKESRGQSEGDEGI